MLQLFCYSRQLMKVGSKATCDYAGRAHVSRVMGVVTPTTILSGSISQPLCTCGEITMAAPIPLYVGVTRPVHTLHHDQRRSNAICSGRTVVGGKPQTPHIKQQRQIRLSLVAFVCVHVSAAKRQSSPVFISLAVKRNTGIYRSHGKVLLDTRLR